MTRTFLYHRTIDPVNFDFVRSCCENLGIHVQPAFPRERLVPADAVGVLIDLDYLGLSTQERSCLLRKLSQQAQTVPVSLYSYNLESQELRSLRANGVLTARGLTEAVVQKLVDRAQVQPKAA